MQFHAFHGVMEQERTVGNRFSVTVKLRYPFSRAMDSDELDGTLNYAEVYDVVKGEMAVPSKLLEHVAGRIRKALLLRFPEIGGGYVKIVKKAPPIAGILGAAAVEIEW